MNREKFLENVSGPDSVHILADFDRTLTYGRGDQSSMISLLRGELSDMDGDYKEKAHALKAKYFPYENDPRLNLEERSEKMMQWWVEHFDLMIEEKLSRKMIESCVDQCELEFRDGFEDMNNLCKKFGIPLVIMSASIGNMIEQFLRKNGFWHDGIHIISNDLEFDKAGFMCDFSKPVVHTLNKTEVVMGGQILDVIDSRRDVILLGDSLGDAGMVDGFEYNNLWSVAFERSNGEDDVLKAYQDSFDTVLDFGSDLSEVVDTLKQICNV